MKSFTEYLDSYEGVAVFVTREEIPGTALRLQEDGKILACEPDYEESFHYFEGLSCASAEEVFAIIDNCLDMAKILEMNRYHMIATMNAPSKPRFLSAPTNISWSNNHYDYF